MIRNLAASAGYLLLAATTLGVAERLHQQGADERATRKLVHAVAGLSPLYTTTVAEDKWAGLLPHLLTVPLNFWLWRGGTLRAVSGSDASPGIVYFPLSQSLLLGWLWHPGMARDQGARLHAALLALALGDAAAALVGQRYGRHRYRLGPIDRSWEGSGAMWLVSFAAIALALRVGGAGWRAALSQALAAASLATGAEALSPSGLDNVAVPLVVALSLRAESVRALGGKRLDSRGA